MTGFRAGTPRNARRGRIIKRMLTAGVVLLTCSVTWAGWENSVVCVVLVDADLPVSA